jgi:tetratricopeptide (TPR) repeat protein
MRDSGSAGAGSDTLLLNALALARDGRAEEARQAFAACAQRHPGEPDAWLNLGNACLACGRAEDALSAFIRAGANGADGVAYLLGRGLALMAAGRHADAIAWLARAHAREPGAADVGLAYAQCLAELERYDDLAECVAGVAGTGLSFDQRTLLARLLALAGRDASALALYRDLVGEQPTASLPRVQLALLLERLNRVQEAAELLASVDADAPLAASITALARARVARRRGQAGSTTATLEAAAEREQDPAMAAQLWFELASCYDCTGQAGAAMPALATAHRQATRALRQRHPQLAAGNVLGWLDARLRRPLPAAQPLPDAAADAPDPVFLVGFPRSGTTLLEQLLARHSALDVLDERPAVEDAIRAMRALPGWRDDDLDASLAGLDAGQLRQLRLVYRARVARHLAPGGRLVDKYPLYLTRVAHIQRLFPCSDWLLLLRHPCDCVLSCHFQAFGLNGGALAFESLESTAHTYASVMGYWDEQRVLAAPRVHTLRYEDLAARPAATLAAVMAFLSLATEPAQHDAHLAAAARTRRINTPSYAQVAEPVHARAVGRWQRYRSAFSPATLAVLAPFAERYGYVLD